MHQRISNEHYRLWCAKLSSVVGANFGEGSGTQGQQQQRDNNSTGQRAPSRARIVADRDYRCEFVVAVRSKPASLKNSSGSTSYYLLLMYADDYTLLQQV